MEVGVPRAVRESSVGRDRLFVGQLAVLEAIHEETARILRVDAGLRLVAARRQQDRAVRGHDVHGVRVVARIQARPLIHHVADRPVGVQPVHREGARKAVRRQQVFAALVDGDVDGPMRQLDGPAERLEIARRIHPERVQVVVPHASGRRALVAAGDVEEPARRMLPPLLHLRGQDQRARVPDQGIAVAANPVEPGAQAGIVGAARLRLHGGRADRTCRDPAGRPREQRVEPTSTHWHPGTSRAWPRGAFMTDDGVPRFAVRSASRASRRAPATSTQSRAGGSANT